MKVFKDYTFDVFCVALAAVLSIIFFDFRIVGIGMGTIIAMLFTGVFVEIFVNILQRKDV